LRQEDEARFDWDAGNVSHIARHNVTPEEVENVFKNDPVDLNYEHVAGEHRWTILGHTDSRRVLTIVFTLRREAFRAITAHDVSKKSRAEYFRLRAL
jgi:uncharacterized DUF497 family protein